MAHGKSQGSSTAAVPSVRARARVGEIEGIEERAELRPKRIRYTRVDVPLWNLARRLGGDPPILRVVVLKQLVHRLEGLFVPIEDLQVIHRG